MRRFVACMATSVMLPLVGHGLFCFLSSPLRLNRPLGPSEVSLDVDVGLRDVVLHFSAIGRGRPEFYAGADGAGRGRWGGAYSRG